MTLLPWKTIGKRLETLRKTAGFTKKEVATYIERDTKTITQIEQGEHIPQLSTLQKLSDLYCVEVIDLISEKEFNTEYNGFTTGREKIK